MFLDPVLELFGIGDSGIRWMLAMRLVTSLSTLMFRSLAFCTSSKLIDAVAQQVLLALGKLLFQRRSGHPVGPQVSMSSLRLRSSRLA